MGRTARRYWVKANYGPSTALSLEPEALSPPNALAGCFPFQLRNQAWRCLALMLAGCATRQRDHFEHGSPETLPNVKGSGNAVLRTVQA
jgi:hypothetical protein